MKTRQEAAAFIQRQLDETDLITILGRPKPTAYHYGKQELRDLLDFIYEGPPTRPSEGIPGRGAWVQPD